MKVETPPAAASSGQAARDFPPEPTDPHLRRLRSLLALQGQAAETEAWAAFHALSAAVRDELDRCGAKPANPAAVADVAHLQLRLELSLRQRMTAIVLRRRQLAALRTYRAHVPA